MDSLPSDPNAKGGEFEKLCIWFLENSPEYRNVIKSVYPYPGEDLGIDIEAKDFNGGIWAIQAKGYSETTTINKEDIDSFLSASNTSKFSHRLLIASTNSIGRRGRKTIDDQEKSISQFLLSDFRRSEIDWSGWKDSKKIDPPKPKTPDPIHQTKAIEDVVEGLKVHDRGKLIMACGTGKTLIAMWAFDQLKPKLTLVVTPSLSLIAQLIRDWLPNSKSKFSFLPVCSDKTLNEKTGATRRIKSDSMINSVSELGYPSTTDSNEISTFLSGAGQRVIFSTYASLPKVSEALKISGKSFDLAIADEAHHCAGTSETRAYMMIDDTHIKSKKRLFMTATPRIYGTNAKNQASENDVMLATMDDISQFGPVLHELNFGDAIAKNVLSDYQVVVIGITDNQVAEQVQRRKLLSDKSLNKPIDAKSLGAIIGISRAIEEYDLKKMISFHSTIDKSENFAHLLSEKIPITSNIKDQNAEYWSESISSRLDSSQRGQMLSDFELIDDKPAVLTNVECLGEGVDVPSIDAVSFIDPKRSQISIVQAVGRAIRKGTQDKVATIILPVFINTGEDPEEILETSDFKVIWSVIKALRDHDEILSEQLDELQFQLGNTGQLIGSLPPKIILSVPEEVSKEFVEAFETHLVERASVGFYFGLGVLRRFVDRENHANVPSRHKEGKYPLGNWVGRLRTTYRNGTLPQDRIKQLELVPGWIWDPNEREFQGGFQILLIFVEREGHALVHNKYKEGDFTLGSWVSSRRKEYRKGALSQDRIKQLEAIRGWSWDVNEDQFQEGIQILLTFVEREGHANVPLRHIEGEFPLGIWGRSRRIAYRNGTLPQDRIKQLESVPGWIWDPNEYQYQEGIRYLLIFVEREGHALVPNKYKEGEFPLGTWVGSRRAEYKKVELSKDRIKQLEEIPGWCWDVNEYNYQEGIRYLLIFVEREGHALVPFKYKEGEFPLGRWVTARRIECKNGTLPQDRIKQLEEMPGWDWDANEGQFQEGFQILLTFVEREGHAKVPSKYKEGEFPLGTWVRSRRIECKNGTLPQDRIKQLESVPGWMWQVRKN